MKIAIMQPYFLPYIGYFQLMKAVDEFVVYDNIQFVKKGWINRNRYLSNGRDALFSLPLKKGSDYLDIVDRRLSDSFDVEKDKILRRLEAAYRKAPCFSTAYPVIRRCFDCQERNLFGFVLNALQLIKQYLGIPATLTVSSQVDATADLKGQDRVLWICKRMRATTYINAIGGVALYDKKTFAHNGIDLFFVKSAKITYRQFTDLHVPNLSILDVMMFNQPEEIKKMLMQFELV